MHKPNESVPAAIFVVLVALALAAPKALAQAGAPAEAPAPAPETKPAKAPAVAVDAKLTDKWENLLHYIILARADLAEAYAKAIIDSKPDLKELYYLSVETKDSAKILARASNMKNLAPLVDRISKMIDDGAKAVRTDPQEITRWIGLLSGGPGQFLSASERLVYAGEYGVPLLINALTDQKLTALARERIVVVLPRLGKEAVRPLCEALLGVRDPAVQEIICQALGKIGYRHAAPYLKELAETPGLLARTREAAEQALAATAGQAMKKPAAELYYDNAVKYYRNDDSVGSDSRYNTANVWYWEERLGVTCKVVPVAIFDEIYAMRSARAALRLDPRFDPAVTVWLAADMRKDAAGAKDPTHPSDEPSAEFYALAASAKNLQRVLEVAMKDGDTAVVVRAIAALAKTAGAENLVAPVEGGDNPLAAALTYPSRQVRYMAGETLALARPQKPFAGSHLVVPVLVEALRQTGVPMVVLADAAPEHRNTVKDLLRGAKVGVTDGATLGASLRAARAAGGVDLVVLASNLTSPKVGECLAMLRGDAVLGQVPVIIVAATADASVARDLARQDRLVVVLSEDKLDAAGVAAAVKEAASKATGEPLPAAKPGKDGDEAAAWAIRAANVLGMLAETRNPVYDLLDAIKSLIAATRDPRDAVRVAAGEALAEFKDAAAQQAIAELAGDANAPEPVRLSGYAALSKSIRQFGNMLSEKQAAAIVSITMSKGSLKIRDGAAQALGAMALPSEKIKDLILKSKQSE